MPNAIAKGSVILTSDATQMNSGLEAAQARLSKFGSQLQSGLSGVLAGNALDPINSILAGGIFGGPAGAAVAGAVSTFKQLSATVDEYVAKQSALIQISKQFGIPIAEVSQLGYAARRTGVDVEDLQKGFKHFADELFKLRGGDKSSANLFAGIGLNPDQLKTKGAVEGFKDVAEQISRMPDGVDKAGAAMSVFGTKIGSNLVPLLDQGRKGLKEFGDEARSMGLILTQADLDAIKQMKRLKLAQEELNEGMSKSFIGLVHDFKTGLNVLEAGALGASGKVLQTVGFDKFGGSLVNAARSLDRARAAARKALTTDRPEVDPAKLKLATAIKTTNDDLRDRIAMVGVEAEWTDLIKRRREGATDAQLKDTAALTQKLAFITEEDKLIQGIYAAGRTSEQVEIGRLRYANLINDAQAQYLRGLADRKREEEAGAALVEKRNPLQNFKDQIIGLDTLARKQKITDDQKLEGVYKAGKALTELAGLSGPTQQAQTLQAGSSEAVSVLLQSQAPKTSQAEKVVAAIEALKIIAQNHRDVAKETLGKLSSIDAKTLEEEGPSF